MYVYVLKDLTMKLSVVFMLGTFFLSAGSYDALF